jgi:NADH-quinone oxidoreductase subunit D
MDVGALTPPLWGFEEREKLMVFYERASGSRMHAKYFRPAACIRTCRPQLIEDIDKFCDPFLKVVDDLDGLLTENRIFKQRNVDIGVVSLEEAWAWGFSGVMVRGSARPGICASRSPTSATPRSNSTFRSARTATATTAICIRMEEMRQSVRIMKQCVDKLLARGKKAGQRELGPQGRAAEAGRDEALDGSADPSLQALHRRLPRAGRRGLCRGRSAEGRVRRLSRRRRHQQAVPLQDPRAGLRPPAGDGLLCRGHMLADVSAILGSLDIVFGEVDR